MIRIVADDKIPFLRGAFEGVASVKYLPGASISRRDLTDADVLITRTRTKCNRESLEGTPVRFIAYSPVNGSIANLADAGNLMGIPTGAIKHKLLTSP